jgi:ACS family glucarate transporter-like MFS transporter
MLLLMGQYFASNFTFFISISWMHPYLMSHYHLSRENAAWYSMTVLLVAAMSQWAAGFLVDGIYRSPYRSYSRRAPAAAGFLLATAGLTALRFTQMPQAAVACFALATFGTEMTLSPSWAYCIDLGKKHSGSVSGAMNMVGNLGGFVSASVFPLLYRLTGDARAYFLVAALLNMSGAIIWFSMKAGTQPSAMEKLCEE